VVGCSGCGGGVTTASQTALNAANWSTYVEGELSSLFSTQLAATGSGVAGLMAGPTSVTRGTQTQLIGAGLGRQLPPGNALRHLLLLLFLDPGTQFPGNEKIALCNTKSTKVKLE